MLQLENLFLAADYVQTSVDLASMEGANEAGRLAAQGVLRRFGLDSTTVETFEYSGLRHFARCKAADEWLYQAGLPHAFDLARMALQQVGRRLRPGRRRASARRSNGDAERRAGGHGSSAQPHGGGDEPMPVAAASHG